jgi:hypothetical protein
MLDGVRPAPDAIVLSPDGTWAALLNRNAGMAQTISGLPDAPVAGADIGLSTLPQPVTLLAIGDTGEALLSAGSGAAGSLIAIGTGGDVRTSMSGVDIRAAAFLRGRPDAVVADGSLAVHLVRDVSRAAAVMTLATERDGLSETVAVGVSRDNRRVFVAGGSGRVLVFGLDGGPPGSIECACAPTRLEPLRGNAVFRATDPAQGRIWLLDGDAPEARFVFVPVSERAGIPRRGGRK